MTKDEKEFFVEKISYLEEIIIVHEMKTEAIIFALQQEISFLKSSVEYRMIEDNQPANDNQPVRNRGPVSKRTMTEDDARKIMIGELKSLSHRAAAEQLGLSYGQIYSARLGFTFKGVYKEKEDLLKNTSK